MRCCSTLGTRQPDPADECRLRRRARLRARATCSASALIAFLSATRAGRRLPTSASCAASCPHGRAGSPYNVKIPGHVGGRGRIKHREFVCASGEMSAEEFTEFLTESLGLCATISVDGAIHFVFMDWRHMAELLAAGRPSTAS